MSRKAVLARIYLTILLFGCIGPVVAQRPDYFRGPVTDSLLEALLSLPPQYQAIRTQQKMQIDGRALEPIWAKAPAISRLVDIRGGASPAIRNSQVKLCWDEQYLYVFASLEEPDLWATLKTHDATIFMDHALEIFIDPDGDMYNYIEFQINAFEAVWELTLSRPYRNGGKTNTGFDLPGLKKAVRMRGTLNQPGDRDQGWDIELAIPLAEIQPSAGSTGVNGQQWRMNFSQVSWALDTKDGQYQKKMNEKGRPLPPDYFVWSPQGRVDLHMPERWGFVQFTESLRPQAFLLSTEQAIHRLLWKYYYLQQDHWIKKQRYAQSLEELRKANPGVGFDEPQTIEMESTEKGFVLNAKDKASGTAWQLNAEGLLQKTKL